MKKIISLFVMVLFVVSLVPAIAAVGENNENLIQRDIGDYNYLSSNVYPIEGGYQYSAVYGNNGGEVSVDVYGLDETEGTKELFSEALEQGMIVDINNLQVGYNPEINNNLFWNSGHFFVSLQFPEEVFTNDSLLQAYMNMYPAERIEDSGEESDEDLYSINQERIEERLELKEKKKLLLKKYEGAKNKLQDKKKLALEIKEGYTVHRDNFKTKLKAWKESCSENYETERCQELKEQKFETAKKFMLKSVDRISNFLEKRNAQYEQWEIKLETLDNFEDRDAMLDAVQKRIEYVNEKLSQLEGLRFDIEAAETIEDLNGLASELKEFWKQTKKGLALAWGSQHIHRFEVVLDKSERLENRLESTLVKLETSGYDITTIRDNVDRFYETLDSTRKLVDAAEEVCAIDGNVSECNKLTKEAHEELKEAHTFLKEILKEIRDADASLDEGVVDE